MRYRLIRLAILGLAGSACGRIGYDPLADSGLQDAAVLPFACNASLGGVVRFTYSPDMVICGHPSAVTTANQCNAESKFCNTNEGWRLCPASTFLQRGGQTVSTSLMAWLKGCRRAGGSPSSPADAICSDCGNVTAGPVFTMLWNCAGHSPFSSGNGVLYEGLATYNACLRPGEDLAQNEGMWIGYPANEESLTAAVCCH